MEECHSNMVSEVQRERILPEVVFTGFCEQSDTIQNPIEPKPVVEPVV